jgi:exodeoxyribonuclease VII small subunit
MKKTDTKKEEITDMLKRLGTIVSWFESQKEMDVEKALEQVKEGVVLIKQSKERLKEIENEFKEIKKSISEE